MISIIAAIDNNNAIGKNNYIPWTISEDLKYFKEKTTNNIIIMGRKTFESLNNKPLPNRINIVVSSNENLFQSLNIDTTLYNKQLLWAPSLTSAIIMANIINYNDYNKEIFVIGGSQIYKQAINVVDKLYITHVNTSIDNPDAFFPVIDNTIWKKSNSTTLQLNNNIIDKITFNEYNRI